MIMSMPATPMSIYIILPIKLAGSPNMIPIMLKLNKPTSPQFIAPMTINIKEVLSIILNLYIILFIEAV